MALPIVIHILNRRRLRKIKFSSLDFIYELNKRRMSKVNFRRWIILLLRTLAVLCLVLAFARPTIQSSASFFMPGEAPKHVVICLDASYSMGAEHEEGTAFTSARDLAGQVVDDCRQNDLVNVIVFADRTEVLFGAGTRNKQLVRDALDDLAVTAEGTSITGAVERAVELLGETEIATSEIYVISDFREDADSLGGFSPPENTRLIFLPTDRDNIDNVSIDRVYTPRKLIRPGEVIRIGVAMTNHSRERAVDFPLELSVDGKRLAEKIVTLSPASSVTETFVVSIADWGSHRCRVAKNRDRLPLDDDRHFVIEVSRKIPVTIIRGRKFAPGSDSDPAAAYFYIEKALNPRGAQGGEFSVSVIDQNALTAANLPGNGVVVWTDPREMDSRRLDLLTRHVYGGGALMVFVGGDRNSLWEDAGFRRLLGVERLNARDKNDGVRLGSFTGSHPIFEIFNEEELELLSQSRVTRFAAGSGVSPDSILAYFDGGAPAVWETRHGRGRTLVVAASPDLAAGNLPLSPMFLPFVHTSVSYLASAGQTDPRRENLVGDDLYFDLAPRWAALSTQLRVRTETRDASGPQPDTAPVLFESGQGEVKAMVARPRHVGFYTLMVDTTRIAQSCVNVDTRESNLNIREFDGGAIGRARVIEVTGNLSEDLRRERQGREVFAVFLLLALCALVAEAILGRKA